VRAPLALLVVALLAMVGGAWLLGPWAVGLVIIGWGAALAVFALLHDWPDGGTRARATLENELLERYRRSA